MHKDAKLQSPSMASQPLENIVTWRERLVLRVLHIILAVGAVALISGSYNAYTYGNLGLIFFYTGAYALVAMVTLIPKVPYGVRASVILVLLCAMAILNFLNFGLSGDGRLFLLLFPFMAFLFFGRRGGLWGLITSGVLLVIFSVAFSRAPVIVPLEVQSSMPYLVSTTGVFIFMGAILLFSLDYLLSRFSDALKQSRNLVTALDVSRAQAETEASRARQQADWLGNAADIARALTRLHSQEELNRRVVQELSQRFHFYQVDLFLVERQTGRLTLVAACGEQGEQWVERDLKIAVGVDSLPGRAVQLGREELSTESLHIRYPESRSELAVPLVIRGDILGVLDIHSQRDTFEDEERRLLRILADQIAALLDTLRLLDESEARSREMRSLYARSAAESWGLLLDEEQLPLYHLGEVPDEKQVLALAHESLRSKQVLSAPLDGDAGHVLIVPLLARGLALGYLAFVRTQNEVTWDAESLALAEDAAGRLASALDNTRLLLESRRRAFFEEQLGHVGDLVWSSSSSKVIMEQSVRELGRLLGAGEVTLYLVPPKVEEPSSGSQSLPARE